MNINKYLPLYISNIEKGHGSFITFDLIELNNKKESVIHVWIYLTDWFFRKINKKDILLDSSETNNKKYDLLFSSFINTKLEKIDIKENNLIEFLFSNSLILTLESNFKYYEADDNLFMFFVESENKTIAYSPENEFQIEAYTPYTEEEEIEFKIFKIKMKHKIYRQRLSEKYLKQFRRFRGNKK